MSQLPDTPFSGPVTDLHARRLPEPGVPAGYAALLDAYGIPAPVPASVSAIGQRHAALSGDGWRLFPVRYLPAPTLSGHLTFALKYEGVDLLILKRLFEIVGPDAVTALVTDTPTGKYARRIWFLYEWLLGRNLPLSDVPSSTYVDVLDPELQLAGRGHPVARQRVRNNLPGTPAFCPLVRRTPKITALLELDLAARARAAAAAVPADLLARTAAFLLLKDSRASYVIEGERPPHDRVERWGRAIGEAGRNTIDVNELCRLQKIVIGDARFVRLGLRRSGGFVGEHDRDQRTPLPVHISARPDDLLSLLDGLMRFDVGPSLDLHPVVAAAVLAFGFVFIHPFEDGNGRLHRYLIHHVLAARHFNPPGLLFPVSATLLARIDEYRRALEAYSKTVLPLVQWAPTADGNVEVIGETSDLYRYFDATPQTEFMLDCVRQTIEVDMPEEAAFLARYDAFSAGIETIADMPARQIDLLFRMLRQNHGRLSNRARATEFAAFTNTEAALVETIYRDVFGTPR